MRNIKIFLAAACAALTLSSCAGTEPNDVAYVVGIGFDKAESGFIITIQYARPTQISGGSSEEGGKGGSEIVENLAVEAPNLYAGLEIANRTESKKFSLSHAKLIVFSAETAEDGISDIMETIARNEEIRPDIYLAVAKNSARDYLFSVKPSVEVNPAKYYQLIYKGESNQAVSQNSALAVYFNYKNGSRDNVLPLAGVTENTDETTLDENLNLGDEVRYGTDSGDSESADDGGESADDGGESADDDGETENTEGNGGESGAAGSENPEKTQNKEQSEAPITDGGFEYRLRDYIAGQSAVNSSNKSETAGMVVFKGDKAQFIIGAVEQELYEILTGDFSETYLTLKDDNGEAITLKVEQEKAPAYKINKSDNTIDISLFLESNVYSMPASYVSEDDIKAFEETAKSEITLACEKFINDTVTERGIDILGFKEKIKPLSFTNKTYEKDRSEVMDYDVCVKTRFVIRRTGLTFWEE